MTATISTSGTGIDRRTAPAGNRPADAPAAALEFVSVSKSYRRGGERVHALRDVDLAVAPGEFVAVVGPSGSGKSTLLHLAGALDQPDDGRILVGGADVAALPAEARARIRRQHIGFVFQFFNLLPGLTVEENVALPLLLDGDRARRARARVAELLGAVGLGDRLASRPPELSGGEMQRVAVARALVGRPALILADEPTGNLDSATGAEVLDLLVAQVAGAGAALVLVTHDAGAAARADRVVTVRDGAVTSTAAASRRASRR